MDMLQGMDVHFQGRGRGDAPEKTVEDITCECTRPNTNVHCNVCGYVTVGRIRKLSSALHGECIYHRFSVFRRVRRVAEGDYCIQKYRVKLLVRFEFESPFHKACPSSVVEECKKLQSS